jgi:hypothetical protein
MNRTNSGTTARAIVDEVLGRGMTREIWTGNYDKVFPVSVQYFDLTAVLPAVFYMFRFGHRRGKGKFLDTFGGDAGTMRQQKQVASIDRVANSLANAGTIVGFESEAEQAILGDLLLSFCLENANRALGRNEPVLRVAPAHYMSSWIDLPQPVVHLRYVPEMIVAMLADQGGFNVEQNSEGDKTWFAVGRGFEDNLLLKVFHKGVFREGQLGSRTSDRFDETVKLGIDQLLMIRLAQELGEAPDKLRGKESGGDRISNQRPIAERAARHFSEDLRHFVRGYAGVIPRHTFVEMLEACMAIGLTTILTSIVELLFEWVDTGTIRQRSEQTPAKILVDCSNGIDRRLRAVAEQSMDDFMRRIERLPVVLMALRLLDYGARYDPTLRKLNIQTRPYATEWINLLGDLLHERRNEARNVLYDLERKAQELSEAFSNDYPDAAKMLQDGQTSSDVVWRIAETLTLLQGRQNTQGNLLKMIDSSLLLNRPQGLAVKRSVIRAVTGAGRKKRDVRSLVFTDAVLDHLVHLHVLRSGSRSGYRPLAFSEFLRILLDRYGFCVDVAPPGLTISNDLLQENRSVLERRLRDLGLLVGVNDAEAMKHLKPRIKPVLVDDDDLD